MTFPWYDATSIDMKADDRELVEARSDDAAEPVDDEDRGNDPDEDVDDDEDEGVEERDPRRNLKRLALTELRRRTA